MARPAGELAICSLGKGSGVQADRIGRVSLLGGQNDLIWKQAEDALIIHVPDQRPGEHAVVFKIELVE